MGETIPLHIVSCLTDLIGCKEIWAHSGSGTHSNHLLRITRSNYPIILNAIPEMRRRSRNGPFGDRSREQFGDYGSSVQDALMCYGGSLNDEAAELQEQLRNPIV